MQKHNGNERPMRLTATPVGQLERLWGNRPSFPLKPGYVKGGQGGGGKEEEEEGGNEDRGRALCT